MSKNIRNVIGALFIFTAFSITMPNCLNLTLTQAYAEDKPTLRNIYLSEGDNIRFSQDIYSYIADVDIDTEEIFVRAKPYNNQDIVKINGDTVTKDDSYKKTIKLEKGKNIIEIQVSDDNNESKSLYTVYVYRGGKEAVYLKDININGKTIGFNRSSSVYNIELDEGLSLAELQTIPDKGNYSITVNDVELSEKNSVKLKFKSIGMYIIKIGVKDKDTERVGNYTLNIYLGIPVSPNVSQSINNVIKPNQWVLIFGRWRYNDSLGESLKDTWFFDNKYNSYFHFNSRGNMQTGWIEDGGKEYYLNSNGQMRIGWLFDDDDEWYFFGSDGAKKTGWIEDKGKWYYLRRDGVMATGWIVNNDKWYYLNSSGAMETGWVTYGRKWYYLNKEGIMETGWIRDDNEWYFLNNDGSMKSGEWFYYKNNWYYINYAGNMRHGWLYKDGNYYYLNENGTMRTATKTIDGYTYKFNEDGSVNFN